MSVRKHAKIDESGEDRSYYHGRISREEAVQRLSDNGYDGSFLLRMSETQDGVYTVSVMQGAAVRHIRVINTPRGPVLSKGDPPEPTVWALIESHMNKSLTNTLNDHDAVSLRYPLEALEAVIAPDLLSAAGEAGMDASAFDADVAAFLEGGVSSREIVRRRSMKHGVMGKPTEDIVRDQLGDQGHDPDLERFMNGAITGSELQRRRSNATVPPSARSGRGQPTNAITEEFDMDNC